MLLVVSAASMAQVDIGLLPFRAQLPDAFYAHVVVEVATDDPEKAGLTLESEQRVYYKKPDSPDVFPYYYPDVGPQAWPAETSELPTVYETPPIPELPIDLFYVNYEIRVHGLDEAAGRSCFLVGPFAQARTSADYCVDRRRDWPCVRSPTISTGMLPTAGPTWNSTRIPTWKGMTSPVCRFG